MDNDTTGLPDNTELPDDTGQGTDTELPADTGQEYEDIGYYDVPEPKDSEPYYDDEKVIPDCEDPPDDPPDDPQQANNTGQSGNTGQRAGLTENEILETAVENAIASLKTTDTPEDVARDVVLTTEFLMVNANAACSKDNKFRVPKTPRPCQIADLMHAMYPIRRVSCAGSNANRRYDILVMYMEDGFNAGIYVEDEEEFYRVALRYNSQLTDREFKEVMKRLRAKARRVTRTMNPDLIAVNNGVFDFKTNELLPFSPDYVFLTKSHVNYNPNATNVVIHNDEDGTDWNVEGWIESLSDDKEIRELLWQILSAVIRPYVPWNKSAWFYSEIGNNGKGTFCVLLRGLCGEDAVATIPINKFSEQFALETLVSAVAIVTDENDVGAYIDKVANLKAIITGDAVSIDRKFLTAINFQFYGFMVQCVNEMPRIKDKSKSFYRRLLIVPFNKCFTGQERTYIKDDYLKRPEVLEYVLYRALNMDFYELSNPEACQKLLLEYEEFNDPVRQFFLEMEERFVWDLLPFDFLYDLYRAWFRKNCPSGTIQHKNKFVNDIVEVCEQSEIWYCKDKRKTVRPTGRMNKPEPMIIQYDLKDWMNPTYEGSNVDIIATPALKENYRGLLRCGISDEED